MITSLLISMSLAVAPEGAAANSCRFDPDRLIPGTRSAGSRHRDRYNPEEPRLFEGIWVNNFEGSAFFEGAEKVSDVDLNKRERWMHIDSQTIVPSGFLKERRHAYRIKMIGCDATTKLRARSSGYGHFGLYSGLVIVNEIIEWEDLGIIER